MTSAADGPRLVALARAALVARVERQPPPIPAPDLNRETAGVFVTVYAGDDLRGCLGTLESGEPLGAAVARLGGDVAHRDYRFEAIRSDELAAIAVEVSVLTAPEPIPDVTAIEIGRDGLIVEQGASRGLLLPQVASEHGWDREMFLNHTCIKAGLPPDAWRRGATVWRFRADVFGEPR